MVGIAVRDVGLAAYRDLGRDLIPDIIIASHLGCLYGDVRVKLVELLNVKAEDLGKVRTHSVVEPDRDGGTIISVFRNLEAGASRSASLFLRTSCKHSCDAEHAEYCRH